MIEILPIDDKYLDLSKEECLRQAEEGLVNVEKRYIDQSSYLKIVNNFNKILSTRYGWTKIAELISEPGYQLLCATYFEFACVKHFVKAAKEEQDAGVPCTIENFYTVEQILECYRKINIFFRRLEFGYRDQDMDFINYFLEGSISFIIWKEVLFSSQVADKFKVYDSIMTIKPAILSNEEAEKFHCIVLDEVNKSVRYANNFIQGFFRNGKYSEADRLINNTKDLFG